MRFILLAISLLLFSPTCLYAADNNITLVGCVKESLGNTDLNKAFVLLYDSKGNVTDSIACNEGYRMSYGEYVESSEFYLAVPRRDSVLVFDVVCEGYLPKTVTYTLDKVGKRERWRKIPTVLLDREPRKLKEVTVTASLIKFYNKGDTIVYNADAFNLAEGSMLDALITQLPGAELSTDGQIKVNGEFVESLLLNGKEFFNGDNKLMLDNIAAYTVKNVEVYKGHSKQEKAEGAMMAPQHLTMDVKLKREYNMGWLVNAQAGAGSSSRYMGRLFASWFNPTTRISFVGNANNLNDNREPGKSDTWTPEMLPDGTKKYTLLGANYVYENNKETCEANGNLYFESTINDGNTATSVNNFLPGGDTYDYSWRNSQRRETEAYTRNWFTLSDELNEISLNCSVDGTYVYRKNNSSSLSGTFSSEQNDMTREALDAIYNTAAPGELEAILNRTSYRHDGWLKHYNAKVVPRLSIKLPNKDRLGITAGVRYESQQEELWDNREINYGSDPVPAYRLRQYTDYSPNHTLQTSAGISYSMSIKDFYLSLNYQYDYTDKTRDYYMYALDRLEDMGVYGVLPQGYLASFDPANSYLARTREHENAIAPYMQYYGNVTDDAMLLMLFSPEVSVINRSLDYWRDNQDFHVKKTDGLLKIRSNMGFMAQLSFRKAGNGSPNYTNRIYYSYRLDPRLPELTDMIELTNNADPLNLFTGNPDLKREIVHSHSASWTWSPASFQLYNSIQVGCTYTRGAITRGYTYDTSTGVRNTSMYNVGGNRSFNAGDNLSWQFGRKKQFTFNSNTSVNHSRLANMIGVNLDIPELQRVNYTTVGEKVKFSWQIGSQTLSAMGDWSRRHTTSPSAGFSTINADHFNYGISGNFKIPGGWGINTDLMMYTRSGYGSPELDTTDKIWNLRLSYAPPRHSRWVFMADGFDMLHSLTNIKYAVTATGRTVSYTNTLPRYFMLSVQYRLSVQPPKR